MIERAPSSSARRCEAFEREFAELSAASRHAVGVANGTDAITIALRALGVGRATRSSCRRSRSTRAPRRSGRPARGRCSATSTRTPSASRRETVKAAIDAAHEGDRRGRPVRLPGAADELADLGVPVLEDAAQAAGREPGDRRAGALGDAGDVLVLPVQEPRRLRRRRRDHDRRRRRSPSASRARCASTARATRAASSTSATTRASTSCRPRSCACCCPSSTTGATRRRAAAARTRRPGWPSTWPCRAVPDGAEPAWHLYVVTHPRAPDELIAGLERARDRDARLLPHAAAPPAGDGAVRAGRARCRAPTRAARDAPRAADEPGADRARRSARSSAARAALAAESGSTSPTRPHVLVHAAGDRARCARAGTRCEVTARDFAQTLELCERFGIEHTAIGRHRGGAPGRQGASGSATRSLALARWARGRRFDLALGHGSNDVTVAAALLRIPRSTMFDYEWATVQHHVNCRLARSGRRARRDPARAPAPLRRARQDPRATRASRRSTTSPTSSPTRRCSPSSGSTLRSRSRSCARRRRSRSTTASRTTCSRRCSTGCAGAQTVVLPRTPEQRARARAGRRLHRARARDRRAVADRLRRPRGLRRRHDEPRGGRARHARAARRSRVASAPSTSA